MTSQRSKTPVPPLDMRVYQYQIIPSATDLEITRIFILAPGSPHDPVIGSLQEMNIADPQPFEALSYVWGPDTTTEDITCDDASLRIRANVARILRKLRHPSEPRPIWVDQICINQVDLLERSKQVRHMNTIYRKAARVLVCLGDEDENGCAERAFALVRELDAAARDQTLFEQFRTQQRDLQSSSPPPEPRWESLSVLFRQPWFDRKWILQEIGTDAPASLLWASSSIPWSTITSAARFLKDFGYAFRRAYAVLVWKPYYMDKLFSPASYTGEEPEKRRLSFAYELHRARWQRCGDPRDHVFALLGHPAAVVPGTEGKRRWVEADYTRGLEEVYHEVAVRLLEEDSGDSSRDLMVLNVVQHESLERALARPLPSWVPHWDDQAALHNLLGDDVCAYDPFPSLPSESESQPQVSAIRFADEEKRVLLCQGVVVDTIQSVSRVLEASDFGRGAAAVREVWGTLPECERNGVEPLFSLSVSYRGPPVGWRVAQVLQEGEGDSRAGHVAKGLGDEERRGEEEAKEEEERQEEEEPALLAFLETLGAVKKRRFDPPRSLAQRCADGAAFLVTSSSGDNSITGGETGGETGGVVVGDNVRRLAQQGNGDEQRWAERVSGGAGGRRFARGGKGWYALVPPAAQVGDRLVLLEGGRTGFVLRAVEAVEGGEGEGGADKEEGERKAYWFVGECYVHGVMDGEALEMVKRGELRREVLEIR